MNTPGDLEDSQESSAAQDADPEWRHEFEGREENFYDTADYDKAVEPVEHGHEVRLKSHGVHLNEHLDRKESDEENVCVPWQRNIFVP